MLLRSYRTGSPAPATPHEQCREKANRRRDQPGDGGIEPPYRLVWDEDSSQSHQRTRHDGRHRLRRPARRV